MSYIPQPEDGCRFSLLASASALLQTGRCDQRRRRCPDHKTTTLVEMLKPAGQLVSIKPPSSTAGLRERVATWARACCSLCRWVEPCSNTSLKLFSPWCCWDTQVTSFWRPKPFLKYTYSDWGWKVFHICDPPRMNPPPSCDDWQRLWVKWHTGSLARASQSPEWWIGDDHQVKVDISLGAKV